MIRTFAELFKIILTADRVESRRAAREVRKAVYSHEEKNKFEMIATIVDKAPEGYKLIREDWRQENYVIAISVMYFLGDKDDQPDFLFPWFFMLMEHKSGNVRHAAIRMFEHEFGPLTVHIRVPEAKSITMGFTSQAADQILFSVFMHIYQLLALYHKPMYNRYKYIHSLPVGVFKSLQLLLSRMENLCGKEYMDTMRKSR